MHVNMLMGRDIYAGGVAHVMHRPGHMHW
jgi:hypothetical protein